MGKKERGEVAETTEGKALEDAVTRESPKSTSQKANETPSETTEKTRLRYVLFSDEAGVFLGSGNGWTRRDDRDRKLFSAPTVADQSEANDYATVEREAGRDVPAFRLVEVTASLALNRASAEDCANRQLPRWNE